MAYPMLSKESVRYRGDGGREHCSLCRHFESSRGGRCKRVLGQISPRGWCRLFSQEARGLIADVGQAAIGGGPSLALDFMTPGTLDPRITFTRASTATYFDAAGVMQTAAVNAPRWDYDPATLQLRGLLIEEARTNLLPWSSDPTVDATWLKSGITSAPPTATANQTTAPDGTLTADRVNFPAVSAGGAASLTQQTLAATAAIYTFSVYLKGVVGGEQTYISIRTGATPYYTSPRITLTTSWQRYVVTSSANLTTAAWFFAVGTDLRDGTQTSTPAQGIYVWGAQLEVQASATSYIPTTSAAVTRAVDICNVTPLGSWFNANAGTLLFDYDALKAATVGGFSSGAFANVLYWTLVGNAATASIASAATVATQTGTVLGAPAKAAVAYTAGRLSLSVNGQATVGNATLPAGPYPWTANLAIGTSPWALTGGNMCGHMRAVKYWNTALPDADMRTLTTL